MNLSESHSFRAPPCDRDARLYSQQSEDASKTANSRRNRANLAQRPQDRSHRRPARPNPGGGRMHRPGRSARRRKTHFVRGLARALGVPPRAVSSPTYVLLNVYPGGRLPVFHLDAYRTQSPEEFEAIGFTELLDQNGVVIVEWAGRIEPLLPVSRIWVSIDPLAPNHRRITISRS